MDDSPGGGGRPIRLCWITGIEALPDGGVILCNTHAGPDNPQVVHVTREKKVVWTLRDRRNFGNDLCVAWCTDAPAGTRR